MGLREVVVDGLFGEIHHKLELRESEGLTLIHGRNGVGKTTVLRLVEAAFNRRFSLLRRLPFDGVQLTLSNGDRLEIVRRTTEGHPGGRHARLDFILVPHSGMSQSWTYRPEAVQGADYPVSFIDDYVPEVVRVGPREWLDSNTGENLDLDEVLDRYPERLPPVRHRPHAEVPDWLNDYLAQVPVFFIEAQRLSSAVGPRSARYGRGGRPDRQMTLPTVLVFADELAEKIRRTLANYGDFSQSLDSTFPSRLLQLEVVALPSEDQIRARYSDQATRRNRYVRAGLLDAGEFITLPDRELDEAERRVLAAYMADIDLKLDQLDDLADKLDLFLSIVNGKFRRKSIVVDRERGLAATATDGSRLELAALSSGEQQEIVLAYGLLFRETPGTLILLDEPELSLHVSWQLDLIPDLLKIAALTNLEFLVATHSPQIINDRWDLTVELEDAG